MVERAEKPEARPIFRRLAGGVVIVCLVLAAAFAIFPADESNRLAVWSCATVGAVMTSIALTGRLPRWGGSYSRGAL